jgi:threo-3-hydroxy-L-aspartate ammonia-lyase
VIVLNLQDIRTAERQIRRYLPKTPLVRCYHLEKELSHHGRIFLKCENLQWTGSFKTRGAFNALLHLSEEEKKRGVISRSSGNFAQALAYAGSTLHVPTIIVMPSNAPEVKKENTAKYGARVLLIEPDYIKQQEKVIEIAQSQKLTVLSPFNHPHVIEGAGTISLEIWEELPTIAQYFCQIGGGGLMAGSATTFKALNPAIEVIGIEPQGANDYFRSRQTGERIRLDTTVTIADGLRAPQVGDLPWPLLQQNVDKTATVTDEEIKGAMRFLYEKMGMIIEPSGAASLAALLFHPEWIKPKSDIACILSGGNVDRTPFFQWIKAMQ